jgi:hypothetical protein
MAYKIAERVRERTSTTGTGPIELNGVISPNYRTFVEGIGDGNTTRYCLLSGNGVDWEIGDNALVTNGSPDTITRSVVFSYIGGVLGTDPINLVGESRVFCPLPADVSNPFINKGFWNAESSYDRNNVVSYGPIRYVATEFIPGAPGDPPTLDGSAKHNGATDSAPITLELTTSLPGDKIVVLIAVKGAFTALPTAAGLSFTERGMEFAGVPIRGSAGGFTIQEFIAYAADPLVAKEITITPSGNTDFSAVAFGVNLANFVYPFDTNSDLIPASAAGNSVGLTTDGSKLFIWFADISDDIAFDPTAAPTDFTLMQSCTYVPAQMGVSGRTVTTQQLGVTLTGSATAADLAWVDVMTSGNAPPNVDPRWVPLSEGSDLETNTPAQNDILIYDETALKFINVRPLRIISFGGDPAALLTADQELFYHRFAFDFTIPADFADYLGASTTFGGTALAADGDVVLRVQRSTSSPLTFEDVAELTIGDGTVNLSVLDTSGAPVEFAKFEVLRILAPTVPDSGLKGVYGSIVGFET